MGAWGILSHFLYAPGSSAQPSAPFPFRLSGAHVTPLHDFVLRLRPLGLARCPSPCILALECRRPADAAC